MRFYARRKTCASNAQSIGENRQLKCQKTKTDEVITGYGPSLPEDSNHVFVMWYLFSAINMNYHKITAFNKGDERRPTIYLKLVHYTALQLTPIPVPELRLRLNLTSNTSTVQALSPHLPLLEYSRHSLISCFSALFGRTQVAHWTPLRESAREQTCL